jgi:hypothetical protein
MSSLRRSAAWLASDNLRVHGARISDRLDRILCTPGLKAILECSRIEAQIGKIQHHTGARRFAWSGAVRHNRTRTILFVCPLAHFIGQHTDTSWDLRPVGVEL